MLNRLSALIVILAASTVPSSAHTYVVTNISDDGNVSGSLRWAIQQANSNPDLDFINFAIGSGEQLIPVSSPLQVTEQVNINGVTQPGYSGRPLVYLIGSGAGTSNILRLMQNSRYSTIQGLGIYGFQVAGISVATSDNFIQNNWIGFYQSSTQGLLLNRNLPSVGSSRGVLVLSSFTTIRNNVISGVQHGVYVGEPISGSTYTGTHYKTNSIQLNRIGTDTTGETASGAGNSGSGIFLGAGARENFLGPDNVISGNFIHGVEFRHPTNIGNVVFRNRIGTNDSAAVAIPNGTVGANNTGWGVLIADTANGNAIGGPFGPNIISGNLRGGVSLGSGSSLALGNWVQFNVIGLNQPHTAAVGAQPIGVQVESESTRNEVRGNVIAGNTSHGVRVANVVTNYIGRNFIGMGLTGLLIPNGGYGVSLESANYNFIVENGFGSNTLGNIGQQNVFYNEIRSGEETGGSER